MRSWRAQAPRQNAKQTKVHPSSSSSRMSGLEHSDCQQYFLIRKMAFRSYYSSSRHAVRPIAENPPDGSNCAWFQGGTERSEGKAPQLTPPCVRMVFDGRKRAANSCIQARLGLSGRRIAGLLVLRDLARARNLRRRAFVRYADQHLASLDAGFGAQEKVRPQGE